jgi:E3 ubiquitin-protein ligase RNF144
MELGTLPPATARLVVELQLADINSIMQDLDAGDAYAAFDAMQAGLKAALSLLQDQICAMEILRADHDDRVVFDNLVQEEIQAERDHEIARGMCDVTTGGTEQSTARPGECFEGQDSWLDDDFQDPDGRIGGARVEDHILKIPRDTGLTYCGFDVQQIQQVARDPAASYAESSTRQLGKGKGKAKEHMMQISCSACMEQFARFAVLELGCKREEDDTYHAYCRGCLIDLFQTSLTDTTLFPPRCCGKYIPASACADVLPRELMRQYEDKQRELASPNPVYCSNRYCGKFIKPGSVTADVAVCQICSTETCTVCKNPKHNGLCPKDPTVQLLMDVAGKQQWQRCPRCRTMVELLVGCYHMRYALPVAQKARK